MLVSGGKMTKALQLARSFHRAGHRVMLVESRKYRFTGHRFSRAVDRVLHRARTRRPRLRRRAAGHRPRTRASTSTCRSAARRRAITTPLAKDVLAPYCEVIHGDAEQIATARRQGTRSPPPPRRSGCRCPTPTASRRRNRSRRSTSPTATYVLKSIPYDPVNRLDLTPLPRATPAGTAAFARSKPIARGQPVDPAGVRRRSGVLHAQHRPRRSSCRSTAAAARRRSRSTTRWSTSPRSRRGCGGSSRSCG